MFSKKKKKKSQTLSHKHINNITLFHIICAGKAKKHKKERGLQKVLFTKGTSES